MCTDSHLHLFFQIMCNIEINSVFHWHYTSCTSLQHVDIVNTSTKAQKSLHTAPVNNLSALQFPQKYVFVKALLLKKEKH